MQNPYPHTCPKRETIYTINRESSLPAYPASCLACAYEWGVKYGRENWCDHHRAFSLEEEQPLLCPTCGKEVPAERANG